jgi:hypothetical protein
VLHGALRTFEGYTAVQSVRPDLTQFVIRNAMKKISLVDAASGAQTDLPPSTIYEFLTV